MTVSHWKKLTDIQSVGLDVCKTSIRVCILTKGQTLDYEIKNNSQEIKQFCKKCKDSQMGEIPFIVESTGYYHLLLALELKRHGLKVKEINPIITKQYTNNSVRGTKTDKTDAEILAKIGVIEGEKLQDFKRNEEEILLKKKISLIANLEMKIQSIKMAIKFYHETLEKLGIVDIENNDLGFEELVALEKLVRRLQKEVEEYRFQKQEDNDKIECLTSIVGVSKYMAVVFYTEFANKRFETKKSMYAFVGYDPKLKQSGSKMIGVRISKRGNAYTRKKLYQCAFCAIQHCEAFQNLYKKMKEKGKHHGIAINVVIKKLIHIMRSLIRHKTRFNPSLI